MTYTNEKQTWEKTSKSIQASPYFLGAHWSYNYLNDPRRLGFVLSRYKFAAKMACKQGAVLELGCSDGIGTTILSENMDRYLGVDLDKQAIADAQINYSEDPHLQFLYGDFMGQKYGSFDAIVSLDVVEHILPEHEEEYFETIYMNSHDKTVTVIGTPNITAAQYASEESNLGHVNLFSMERLKNTLEMYYCNVFPFGMNDEVCHTGYSNMCHYILCVACNKK